MRGEDLLVGDSRHTTHTAPPVNVPPVKYAASIDYSPFMEPFTILPVRFTLEAQPARKFALIAEHVRDATQICQALHRRGGQKKRAAEE